MLLLSRYAFLIKTLALATLLNSAVAQAEVVELVKNGSLTGTISNGVASGGSSLPPEWFASTNSATQANTPDTMDSANNVGVSGATNFAATPSASPDGGTWIGVGKDASVLSEGFYQVVTGLTIGQSYTLSWYDANFGISSNLSPSIYTPFTGSNRFIATLSGLSDTIIFTGESRSLGTGWLQNSFTFVSEETSYTLALGLGNPTKSYLSIDGISITTDVAAVPEPQTWAFLITGVLMVGFATRRKDFAKAS